MQLIENMKTEIGKLILNRSFTKRVAMKVMPDFASMQSIAILYDASNKQDEEEVAHLASYLREQGKKVMMMGFVNEKNLPFQKKFHISSQFFWREYLNFFNLPIQVKLSGFIKEEYDLLINLYTTSNLPLMALSSYSNANYRIGAKFEDAEKFNEILIDGASHSLYELGLNMVHYLKSIRKK